VSLLERVAVFLSAHGVRHALIGAAALAAHGVSRSTADQDLLVVDARVLDAQFWASFREAQSLDVRTGDADDPLVGVVRLRQSGDRDVDVIVGRGTWQSETLQRAVQITGGPLFLVEAADLILLKLYAGGSRDRWDIEQLLALDTTGATRRAVDERVKALSAQSRDLWRALRTD
jgi:hypothetical protein